MSPRSRTFWRAEPPFRRKRRGARAFAPAPRSRTPGVFGLLRPRPARVLLACPGFCARALLVSSWRVRAFAPALRSCPLGVSGFLRPRPARVLPVLLAHGLGENVDAASQPCRALLLRTGRVRSPALLRIGSLCIGAGNGALGQAVCLPHCGLACPIVWFRAPVRLQVGSLCIGVGNGALGQAICLPRCGLACPIVWFRAPVRLAGVRFHSDTSAFTVIPRSASVIPLAK